MPIYEYTCRVCSNAFERLRPVSSMDDEVRCPDCGSESERQLSVFASFSSSANGETSAIAGGGGCACSMTV